MDLLMKGALGSVTENGSGGGFSGGSYSSWGGPAMSSYGGIGGSGSQGFANRIKSLVEITEKAKRAINELDVDGAIGNLHFHDDHVTAISLQSKLTALETYAGKVMYNVIEKVGGTTAISSIKMGNLFGQLSTPTSGFISKLGFDTYASIGLGSIAAVADAWGQVGEGENVINATTKGIAHTVMATSIIGSTTSAGATLGATIGSVFPGPGTAIGGAAGAAIGFVAGVAISMGADKVFDTVYDNTVGKVVDWAMDNPVGASINHAATEFVTNTNKAIGKAVDSTVSDIKNTVKDIGNAVGGWFNGLGSVFG